MFPIEPELIIIPAGSFLFGINEEQITALTSASHGVKQRDFEHERSLRTLTLPTYAIGKFEVTIGQYRAFIEAGGYTDPLYWTQAGWYWRKQNHIDAPRDWENPTYLCWGSEDFPIVGVSCMKPLPTAAGSDSLPDTSIVYLPKLNGRRLHAARMGACFPGATCSPYPTPIPTVDRGARYGMLARHLRINPLMVFWIWAAMSANGASRAGLRSINTPKIRKSSARMHG
jgi:hypothetical protein